ncbi:SNF2 family N-terminal domain-containing protein [Emericellopsis atlantica]|uniref:SNF2 family N-terminal domain-containing protein n=1 Tax=Emericellopsis atlantica TaxID=2614577 RepID=A0A9P7ZIP2_9HYPO|nr:SNF2 family N-terminal domain-containing protein [Emericellopsis atlantica]KAG9252641.1 SNF2 family N-terminal domain-containing protein [Emericellopsis atlantica]
MSSSSSGTLPVTPQQSLSDFQLPSHARVVDLTCSDSEDDLAEERSGGATAHSPSAAESIIKSEPMDEDSLISDSSPELKDHCQVASDTSAGLLLNHEHMSDEPALGTSLQGRHDMESQVDKPSDGSVNDQPQAKIKSEPIETKFDVKKIAGTPNEYGKIDNVDSSDLVSPKVEEPNDDDADGSDSSSDDERDRESDDSYQPEDERRPVSGEQTKGKAKSQAKNPGKAHRPRTPKEYWLLQLQKEPDWNERAKEALMKQLQNQKKGGKASAKAKVGGSLMAGHNTRPDMENANALVMPGSSATTHATQFKFLRRCMPPGGDTRRSSNQFKDLKMGVQSFGFQKLTTKGDRWYHKSMKAGLMSYQVPVTAWMNRREVLGQPHGGLVADEMGMGKTIVTLFCMSTNPPEGDDLKNFRKATLVVVPNLTVAGEWLNKTHQHCIEKNAMTAVVYKSSDQMSEETLGNRFMVITTYNTLLSQHPSMVRYQQIVQQCHANKERIQDMVAAESKVLFKIPWYRVVLDEAQQIKNGKSITARACWNVQAKNRWCLSGTPLANAPKEFFPYLEFLKYNNPATEKAFAGRQEPPEDKVMELEVLVSMVMYRRTKNDTFMNAKILDIPQSHSKDIIVPSTAEEDHVFMTVIRFMDLQRQIRDGVCYEADDEDKDSQAVGRWDPSNMEKELDRFANEGKGKGKSELGNKLCRAASHPFNLDRMLLKKATVAQLELLIAELAKLPKHNVVDILRRTCDINEGIQEFQRGLDMVARFSSPTLSGHLSLTRLLELAVNQARLRLLCCAICGSEEPEEPMESANCSHVFCGPCIMKHRQEFSATEKSNPKRCPGRNNSEDCSAKYNIFPTVVSTVASLANGVIAASKKSGPITVGADSNGQRLSRDPTRHGIFLALLATPNHRVPPSPKTTMAMGIILQWLADSPEDKIVVFTQFIPTAAVLGHMLQVANIPFLYYYGELCPEAKSRAVNEFQTDPSKKVMLVGLRAGSTALDLYAANRVILVDLWWNTAVEDQALGRVWRIGQEKVTHMRRIRTTMEINNRIVKMQEDKKVKVRKTLQDDGPSQDDPRKRRKRNKVIARMAGEDSGSEDE